VPSDKENLTITNTTSRDKMFVPQFCDESAFFFFQEGKQEGIDPRGIYGIVLARMGSL
jgi:hypothetical protein